MSLLILCFTLILFLPTNAEYFINPTSSGYSPDGTRDNPYKSLDEALQSLGSGTYELVLLGDEYSLQASIIIPEDSQYTIRPDKIPSENDYFLLKLEPGSNITVYQADLVLKDIQIVELDKDQPYEESTFFVTYGNLTLNNVRVSDIVYLDWGYTFILIEGDGTAKSQLNILNSAFENIINAEIAVISAKLTIKNSTFTGLQQIDGPLIFLYGNNASELDTNMIDIVLTNSSFEYSRDSTPTNFLSFYSCTVDVKIENLVAKDLMITNGSPLIEYISDFENSNSPTSFEVNNVKFENIYEKLNNVNGIQGTGNGLIFDIFGTTNLMMFNVSVSSVILQYASMLAYNPNTDNFLNKEILFPSATIKGFIIENSCGTNLLFSILDTVTLEDIHLKDNFLNTTDIDFAMFALMNVTKSYVRNFRSTNHSGPIIKMYEVLNQEFYDCIFEGTTTSHDLTTTFQNIISISRTKEFGLVYYPEDNVLTIFQNVVINGYDDIDPMNMTQESNDTYAIIVRSDIGKVYIRDSRFYNLKMGGFLSTAITYLEIDNFIADSDPSIPSEQISWHRLFQFVNIGQLIVKNSAFLNNKNINLFNLFNIRRDEIYDTIEYTQLDFSNITVINNQIDSSDPNDRYSSLIVVSSPLKSVQVTLSDSYFKDNIITSGIILFEESYVVDLYLENNRFDSNLAREYGAVFTARDMQDEYSTVQFQRNIFTNNTCLQKGGIFAFIATKHQITADNNSYIGNSAGISGGVGYILKSRAYYIESNGYYYNNSAGVYGGAWYFSVARSEGVAVSIHFENTTFDTLVTNQKGGALYIVTGSLNLRNSVFKQNKALIAGGDIYLIALSTLNISQVTFTGSYAAQGPLLYAETIYDETINIDNCMITDISSDHADTALIQTNAGSFKVTNTVFAKISSSLFMLEGTSIEFSNVLLNEITCSNTSTFCVLRGNFINLTLSNSNISQVISESDLIVLNFPSKKVIVDEVYVSDVMLPTEKKINGSQLFALKVFLAEDISLFDSSFDNLTDFSCIRAERSHLSISNSRFSNMRKDNDSLSEKAQFLVLDTSDVTIQSTLFEGNQAVNDQINGGAIQIMGSGGDYNIQDSIFKKNSAFEGGAISVEGSVDSFDLDNCLFEDNTAISMGGGIYFVPEVIENKALIKDCLFEENEANKGGAIHLKNEDMSIHGSTFRRNSANDGPAISFTEAKNNNPFEEGNTFEDN